MSVWHILLQLVGWVGVVMVSLILLSILTVVVGTIVVLTQEAWEKRRARRFSRLVRDALEQDIRP